MAFKSSSWILPLATLRTSFNRERTDPVAGFIYTIADDPIRVIWPGTGTAEGKHVNVESAFYKCEIVDTKHIIDALVDKSVADSLLSVSHFTNMNELRWTLISIRSYCVQALLFKNVGSDPKGIIRPVVIVKEFIGFPHASLGLPVGELRDHIMENKDAQALMLELKSQNAFCSLYVRPWSSPEQESRVNNMSVEEKTLPGRDTKEKTHEDENKPVPVDASLDSSDQCLISEEVVENSQQSDHQVFDSSMRTALRESCQDDCHYFNVLLNMASGDLNSISDFLQSGSQQPEEEGTPERTAKLESHTINESPKARMTTLVAKRRLTPDASIALSKVQSVVKDGKTMNDSRRKSASERQAPYSFIFKDENSQKVFEVEGSQRSIGQLTKFIEQAFEVNSSQDNEEGSIPISASQADIDARICDCQDRSHSESLVVEEDMVQSSPADPPLEFIDDDGIKPVKARRVTKSGLKKRRKRISGTRTTVLVKVQTPARKVVSPTTSANHETKLLSETQESNKGDSICAAELHSQAVAEVKRESDYAYFTRSSLRKSKEPGCYTQRTGTNANLKDISYVNGGTDTRREPEALLTSECEEGDPSSQVAHTDHDPADSFSKEIVRSGSEKGIDTSSTKTEMSICIPSKDREDLNKSVSSLAEKEKSLILVPLKKSQYSGKQTSDTSTSRESFNSTLPAPKGAEVMPEVSTGKASLETQNLEEEANVIKKNTFSPCLLPDIYGEQLLGWEYFERSQSTDQALASGATQNARNHVEESVTSLPDDPTDNENEPCAVKLSEENDLRSTSQQADSNDASPKPKPSLYNRLLEAITTNVRVDRLELREFAINYWTWRVNQQAE